MSVPHLPRTTASRAAVRVERPAKKKKVAAEDQKPEVDTAIAAVKRAVLQVSYHPYRHHCHSAPTYGPWCAFPADFKRLQFQ